MASAKKTMTNEDFQLLLRAETKRMRKTFLKIPDCPRTFRQWNKYKLELKAIRSIMINHPEVTNRNMEKLIKQNPTTLRFINNCLTVVPDMLDMLRSSEYEQDVLDKYYERRLATLRKTPTNRGRKKLVKETKIDIEDNEDNNELIK